MDAHTILDNLDVVSRHMSLEFCDTDRALDVYTHDVSGNPRGIVLHGKHEAALNHERMREAMRDVRVELRDRFATAERAVDESVIRFTLAGPGIDHALLPIGSRTVLRRLHVFEMRAGRIARERVFEAWAPDDELTDEPV